MGGDGEKVVADPHRLARLDVQLRRPLLRRLRLEARGPLADQQFDPLVVGALAVVDVGVGAEPGHDLAVAAQLRQRAAQVPSIGPVGAQDAALALEGSALAQGGLEQLDALRAVLGVEEAPRALGGHAFLAAGVRVPAVVPVLELAVGQGPPDDLRNRLGEVPVAPLAGLLQIGERGGLVPALRLLQPRRLLAELRRLAREFDEDRDFRANQVGRDRLDQVVGGAHLVGALEQLLIDARGGEEDDGHVAGALALLDDPGQPEAVHGEEGVEEDEAEFAAEQGPQGAGSGVGLHERVAGLVAQDGTERSEIFCPVVDEKNRDREDFPLTHRGIFA